MDSSTFLVFQPDGPVLGGLLANVTLGEYASPIKMGMSALVAAVWLATCGWTDRDARRSKVDHSLWLGIVYASGVLGFVLGLLLPWSGGLFVVGWLLYVLAVAAGSVLYIRTRNARVPVEARISFGSVIRRVLGWFTGKEIKEDVHEKIRITDASRHPVKIPKDNDEQVAYSIAQDLLIDAMTRRASDVDIVPSGEQIRLAYRIDGVVGERDPLEREPGSGAVQFIKQIAGLDVEERRRPQMGVIETTRGISGTDLDKQVTIEVRTSGSTAGERMMLRVLAEEANFRLPDLGLTDQQLALLEKATAEAKGLIIVCGPKSSGLTSTLYAYLRGCDCFTQNIHTFETDAAMDLENITQNEYDPQLEDTPYVRQLQSVLRRDPDILVVEDCPDRETARVVAMAATERQKIYLGMNAKSCLEALKRYMSMVGDHDLAAKPLRALMCQRLVRILCDNCREAYKPDADMLRKANLPVDRIESFYRAAGTIPDKDGNPVTCPVCLGTGYVGRTSVFEIMAVNEEMRMALSRGDLAKAKAIARRSKPPMLYLQEEGLRKVMAGTTSMKEFLRAVAAEEG